MRKYLIWSIALLLFFLLLGTFLVWSEREGTRFPFSFGLDLVGGTELVYRADTSRIEDVDSAMATLKEVIERRINIFGVSEPLVQTESAGLAVYAPRPDQLRRVAPDRRLRALRQAGAGGRL